MIFGSFPNNSATIIPPSNFRRGKEVRNYVEHYAKSQQLKQEEAFQVQGSDLIIWNRILSPRICTCQGLESSINNNPAVINDTRPVAVEQSIKVQNEYLKTPKENLTNFKSKKVLNTFLNDSGLQSLGNIVDTLYDEDEDIVNDVKDPIIKSSMVQGSLIEEAFLRQKAALGVDFADYVNCPICYGTKHTGAYQPHRGIRLILDASDYYPINLFKASINKTVFPHKVNFFDNDSYVEWTVNVPKYFKVVSLKPYNLEIQSTSVKLSYAEYNSNTYTDLTIPTLQNRNGLNNNNLKIRCSVNPSNINQRLNQLELSISHVEIVLLYNEEYDKGELPLLTIPEQIDYQELFLRSKITLSPSINSLNREDLICENKYGLLWKVIDVEKSYTVGGLLTLLRAEIRLVQNSEKLYNLSMFARKLNTVKPDLYNNEQKGIE